MKKPTPPSKPTYSLEAPDQARLKAARLQIEAILRRYDLGGAVVLHTPGMTEFFHDIRPSYSCVWIDDAAGMARFRSKLADYAGDAKAQRHDQIATANMLHGLAMDLGRAGMMFLDIAEHANRRFDVVVHTEGELVRDPMEGKLQ